jgi:response regulator of citrate/malate metabolism
MPGNHDLDLVHHLPALNAGLQVILVTGYPSVPTAVQALQLPILAYLVKPLDFQELLGHLKRGLALRQVAATLADSSRHLERWVEDMKALGAAFQARPQAAMRGTLNGALTLALGNLAGTIADLQTLFQLAAGLETGRVACDVQSCPRVAVLEQAIQEGVEVLEATKDAFHSRKLRDLRQKLEALLPAMDLGN